MLGAFGCSSSTSNPAAPDFTGDRELSESETSMVWGVYDLYLNTETMTLEASELKGVETHYDITSFIAPSCVFNLISYNPLIQELIFDLQMTNPSALDVYDVRALMLELPGGGYSLNNADDYTFLFNLYSTTYPNPFKAYAKSVTDRKFAAGDTHTENFDIELPPGFIPPLQIRLLVECSYPSNCEEPYIIENQSVSNSINSFTPALISLDTHDHQNNIGEVKVDTTPITGSTTALAEVSPDHWQANVINSTGAIAGIYKCLIISDSWSSAPNLYDYVDIVVIPDTTSMGWNGTDYNVPFHGCSMDLGVIADPGGSRDSEILTVGSNVGNCDAIMKNKYHYSGVQSLYADLFNADPNTDDYRPFPVERLDAADDGAFSFTNGNWSDLFDSSIWLYNAQIWTCYDNVPSLHYGPAPDESRYWFDFLHNYDTQMRPADVCDDFSLGQYALFTSTYTWSPQDLIFVGTNPKYTHDRVSYMADMDAFAGIGPGKVNPNGILGIDVVEVEMDVPAVTLYVLEQSGSTTEVEVFYVFDTAAGWGWDTVSHVMTINVSYILADDITHLDVADGKDLEILPINNEYTLNPNDPTICVLVTWGGAASGANGEVMLYNAYTGAWLENVGDTAGSPALKDSYVQYLDTDDGDDWEIHVSRVDAAGNTGVKIFDYS